VHAAAIILSLLLFGPAQTLSGKYVRPTEEESRRWAENHPGLFSKKDSVEALCARIENGNDGPAGFAALGEALLAQGEGALAYRAFHKAQRLWLESKDKQAAGRMQVKKDVCPRVPDRVIAAEEREAMIWVDALESYERAQIARGEDPTDREAFFERYGRPEEDLNAIVRSHRIAFLGSVLGMFVGLASLVMARRLRRRIALVPLLIAAALLVARLTLVRPGPLLWGALFALAGGVAVSLLGRADR
jgi:hypothetical protein